ncbi:MAG TPA: SbcC/MukB-like Walker B domain-containing protein, partial [Terriglobales bacterium]|nr:SbcC/MukB-like Walker B domain-containing protein [Terriglobales bacterium]
LLGKRLANVEAELNRFATRIKSLVERRNREKTERDNLRQTIAQNGGDRIERIKQEITAAGTEKRERMRWAEQYDQLTGEIGLPSATDADGFSANQHALQDERNAAESRQAETQNAHTENAVELRDLKAQHDEREAELNSLRQRRSNIPRHMLDLRKSICEASGLAEEALPFAGELIQVRSEARDWEGAIERLLHNFGLSILVADTDYTRVAEWVDRTHLGERLVYFRVRDYRTADHAAPHPASLVRKIALKPDCGFYGWMESELARRFDYACCDTLDQFRRERQAITRSGQVKSGNDRHEKDDRHRINDRSRFVLGWSNEAKIAALEKQSRELARRMQAVAGRVADLEKQLKELRARLGKVEKLGMFNSFQDVDWRPLAAQIDRLEQERRQLEEESDVLRALQQQLTNLETASAKTESDLSDQHNGEARAQERQDQARTQLAECENVLAATPQEIRFRDFPRIEAMRDDAQNGQVLTVESCDNRERDMRDWLQMKIDAEDQKIRRLVERIVKTMQAYANLYPLDTQETDASVAAAGEYRAMLDRLTSDDLPRFEARFKDLLNENTIREVANFQSQLNRERQTVGERIDSINQSLNEIDYNPGRYIVLEAEPTTDTEIRDFQQDLRACTEGSLTGSEEQQYSEAKFLQVRRIIDRFRGRIGLTGLDRDWTHKVTDTRNWFTFSVSERWREDGREHEHYPHSGGKSGGQKERLAYTVLAAGLAYQFGLDAGSRGTRSFRFVLIDEAFARGTDESARRGLELFQQLDLQLLVVTPLQKIHIIEPFVANVGFVHNEDGRLSMLRNLSIEEYRAERASRSA